MLDDPEGASRGNAPAPPARSRLAVASGVMGLVSLPLVCFGAGLSGAMAVVLGMMALERIRLSGRALRGKPWAWTGISTGLITVVLSIAWVSFANSARQEWNRQLDDGLRRSFAAIDESAAREALPSWSGKSSAGVSITSLQEFALGVRERLGALESVSLVSQDASAGSLATLMVVHVVSLGFEKGTRSAAVSTELRTPVDSWTPSLKLLKINLNDAEAPGGELEFPARAVKPADSGGLKASTAGASEKEALK